MRTTDELSAANGATVIEQSIQTLRAAVMSGDLRPGQKLVEADLIEDLGISRASLREALRVLEADRLIELIPNRGPFVAKLGPEEVEDIHDVWALMTGEMVHRFAARAQAKEIAGLGIALRKLKLSLRDKDTLAQLAATNAFFNYISTRCGNVVLMDMVQKLVARINFLRARALSLEGRPVLCAGEISDIFDAIKANRPAVARAATKRHIASACAAAKKAAEFVGANIGRRSKGIARRAM
jgi:DNA-binding GntR family transcriptional regulator